MAGRKSPSWSQDIMQQKYYYSFIFKMYTGRVLTHITKAFKGGLQIYSLNGIDYSNSPCRHCANLHGIEERIGRTAPKSHPFHDVYSCNLCIKWPHMWTYPHLASDVMTALKNQGSCNSPTHSCSMHMLCAVCVMKATGFGSMLSPYPGYTPSSQVAHPPNCGHMDYMDLCNIKTGLLSYLSSDATADV